MVEEAEEQNYKLKKDNGITILPINMQHFFFVYVLSKVFVLHGTPSCLLVTHRLTEIWLLFHCDFFKITFNKERTNGGNTLKLFKSHIPHRPYG